MDDEINQEINNEEKDIVDGQRFVHKKRRERHVRKGRMKQERIRLLLKFLLSFALIFGFYIILKNEGWYLDPNVFQQPEHKNIEIINNHIVPTKKILSILKTIDIHKEPIYMDKTNNIKKELLKLKPVEDVYIRRYAFPARIQIIFREKIPVITIAPDSEAPGVAFFTADGTLVGREFLPLNKSYNTLLVLSYGKKGDDYKKWDLNKVRELQKIARYVENYSKEPVEYIDCRIPNDMYVKIKSVNIRLGKIDDTIFKRIERIPSILPQVKEVNAKVKYLDLSWEKVNYLKLE